MDLNGKINVAITSQLVKLTHPSFDLNRVVVVRLAVAQKWGRLEMDSARVEQELR